MQLPRTRIPEAAAWAAAILMLSGNQIQSRAGQIDFWKDSVKAPVDLTAEGTEDWVLWDGTGGSLATIRKNGAGKIGALTLPGFIQPDTYSKFVAGWSDGTPTASSTATARAGIQLGVWWTDHNRFTVPADQTTRTLRLYVSSYKANGTIVLNLSDSSAAGVSDGSLIANPEYLAVYTVVYRADSPNQSLSVEWDCFFRTNDGSASSLRIHAATLSSGAATQSSAAPPVPALVRTVRGNGMASLVWKRVDQASSYNIYRSTTSGNTGTTPHLAGKVAFNERFFPADFPFYADHGDYGLTNGTTYYYQITAVNGTRESAKSPQISVTPAAAPTSDITRKRFLKILPVGNSITQGPDRTNWRDVLEDSLTADGYDFTYVGSGTSSTAGMTNPYHEGWGLRKIDDIRRGVATRAFQSYCPDLALLEIGTNNFAWIWPNQTDVTNALRDYDSLLATIFRAQPNVCLLVSPILPLGPEKAPSVDAFNAGVKAKVDSLARSGKRALWNEAMQQITFDMLGDGVHPSDAGYNRMGSILFQAIKGITNDNFVGVRDGAKVRPALRPISGGTSVAYTLTGARLGSGGPGVGNGVYVLRSGAVVSVKVAARR